MELIALAITGIVTAIIAVAGIAATFVVMLRDGYGQRPFKSTYDTRQPL